MTLEAWIAFCLTETALCFIPGPAVLFVVSVALARGGRGGIAAALGIVAGNTFYFALSATGIAAVIVASSELFAVLKWCGAGYLVWIGLRMLFVRPATAAAVSPQPIHRAFVRGFVVQTANPKALIFFVALLPQFIDASASIGWQVFVFGVSSVVIELVVLCIYIAAAVKAREFAGQCLRAPLERVGGAFLLMAGIRLALIRS
jgi:threonine/homoserine/homoserine lactone efflux protein